MWNAEKAYSRFEAETTLVAVQQLPFGYAAFGDRRVRIVQQ